MKHVIAFLIISLVLIGISCKEKTNEGHNHVGKTDVKLDAGKRWLANAETTEGIQTMLVLTDAYLADPTSEVKQLQGNLKSELSIIFQKCTMKGESHDQLHNYLLPLKEKIEALDNSGDVQTIEDIKQYLETYKNYFE